MTGGLKVTIYDYLRVIFHRKWHIAISIVVVMTAAAVYAFHLAREVWSAENQRVRVVDKLGRQLTKNLFSDEDLRQRIFTIRQRLSSKVKAEEICRDLLKKPQLAGREIDFDDTVQLYLDSMKMELRGEFVAVEVEAYDPELAKLLVERLIEQMIVINDRDERENLAMSDDAVSRTHQDLLKQLEEAQQAYYDIKPEDVDAIVSGDPVMLRDLPKPPAGADANSSDVVIYTTLHRLSEARKQQDDVKRLISEKTGQLQSLEDELAETPRRIDGEVVVQQNERARLLREEIDKHRHLLHQMLIDCKENHPMVRDKRARIRALEEALERTPTEVPHQRSTISNPRIIELQNRVSAARADLEGLTRKRDILDGQIQELGTTFKDAYREMGRRRVVFEQIQSLQEQLLQLRNIKNKVEAERAFNYKRYKFESNDRIVVSEGPVRPNKPLVMLMGLMLGIVTAGGVVFVVEYADHSIKGIEDARRFLDLPVLAAVPLFGPEADSHGGVGHDTERDKGGSSLKRLAGNLAGAAAVIALLVGAAMWTFSEDDLVPMVPGATGSEETAGVDEGTGDAIEADTAETDPGAMPATSAADATEVPVEKTPSEVPDPGALWSNTDKD
ncbi:MAG: GumC family protein [Planctomycetota bacterium]